MEYDGIINIRKEAGMTSHDVVGKVRKILKMRRIGHTGTLDPMATGVLPVCAGRSARIVEFLDLDHKVYHCTMRLGIETETRDVWGTPLKEASAEEIDRIGEEDVRRALSAFTGTIRQTPPLYSAVKVNGKRLYEYAREGKSVEIPDRTVVIYGLAITDLNLGRGKESTVTFDIECSKGTFIRSICHDAGRRLGVGAAMAALTRTRTGIFRIEDAVTLDELRDMEPEEIRGILTPCDAPLTYFGTALFQPDDAVRFINGLVIPAGNAEIQSEPEYAGDCPEWVREEFTRAYRVYSNGCFVGIAYRTEEDGMKPAKVFARGGDIVTV